MSKIYIVMGVDHYGEGSWVVAVFDNPDEAEKLKEHLTIKEEAEEEYPNFITIYSHEVISNMQDYLRKDEW